MNIGESLPDLPFKATHGSDHFGAYRGKWLILYFYPKDSTPGCTLEGRDFRDAHESISALNAVVFGISRDTLACHERFKNKQGFTFDLIEDRDETICQQFDVIKQKKMFGLSVRGIERSTFLIDPQGVVVKTWRKVKVSAHVAEVVAALALIQRTAESKSH